MVFISVPTDLLPPVFLRVLSESTRLTRVH